MRKTLITVALAGLAALTFVDAASAQRRGAVGGLGGTGYYPGTSGLSFGIGNSGYYGGRGYGAYPYYGGYQPGISINLGGYNRPGYSSGYYYPNTTSGYYYAPQYTYDYGTQPSQSFYSGPAPVQQLGARVRVIVPHPDAQVFFGDTATTQRGTDRVFESPALQPGQTYNYTVRARWMENGQPVERQRQVQVQTGQDVTVNFMDGN